LKNTPVAATDITQIISSWFDILVFFVPAMHKATVITVNNLHSAANVNWKDSFSSQKFNHSILLQAHQVLSAGFHFTHNSNITS